MGNGPGKQQKSKCYKIQNAITFLDVTRNLLGNAPKNRQGISSEEKYLDNLNSSPFNLRNHRIFC